MKNCRRSLTRSLLLWAFLCGMSACTSPSPDRQREDFERAVGLQESGASVEAAAIYRRLLDEGTDPLMRSRIYHNLGSIYLWDRVFGEAYACFRNAYVCDSVLGDVARQLDAQLFMARSLAYQGDSLAAVRMERAVERRALQVKDSASLYKLYKYWSWHWQARDSGIDSAYHYLVEALRYAPSGTDTAELFVDFGRIFMQQGRVEEARPWFEKAAADTSMDTRLTAHYFLSQMEQEAGKWEAAYRHLFRYTLSVDTLYARQRTTELERQALRHEADVRVRVLKERHRLYAVSGGMAFVFVCLGGVSWLLRERRRRRAAQAAYAQELADVRAKEAWLRQLLDAEVEEKEKLSARVEEEIRALRRRAFLRTTVGKRVATLAGQDRKDRRRVRVLSAKEQEELRRVVADIYDDEVRRLRTSYPRLTDEDVLYVCLTEAGLGTFAVALCFGHSDEQVVYQRRYRLKQRMGC